MHAQLQGAALERDGEHVRLRLRAVAGGLVVVLLRKLERGAPARTRASVGPGLNSTAVPVVAAAAACPPLLVELPLLAALHSGTRAHPGPVVAEGGAQRRGRPQML